MKRCLFLLLMVTLSRVMGFSMPHGENPDHFIVEEWAESRKDPPHSTDEPQDTARVQQQEALQNNRGKENQQELINKEEPQDKTKIKMIHNLLVIENLPEDGVLEIYNIMGAKVYNRRVKAGTNQYPLSLQKGYYIIKIGKLTRKIAIK